MQLLAAAPVATAAGLAVTTANGGVAEVAAEVGADTASHNGGGNGYECGNGCAR